MLGLDCQNYRVAWSRGVLNDLDAAFIRAPLECIANDGQFPLTDVFGEFGNENLSLPGSDRTPLGQIQPRQLL
jgi:hypothetical protein